MKTKSNSSLTPETPPSKGARFVRIGKFLVRLAAILFICITLIFITLRVFLERKAVSFAAQFLGVEELEASIQNISFSRAALGPLTLGDKASTEELRIENFAIEYDLPAIFRAWLTGESFPIQRIYLSGAHVAAQMDRNGEISLKTSQWSNLKRFIERMQNASDTAQTQPDAPSGVSIARVVIRNCQLDFYHQHRLYSLNVDGVLSADTTHSIFDAPYAGFKFYTESHALTLVYRGETASSGTGTFTFKSDLSRLPRLLTDSTRMLDLRGSLNVSGTFGLTPHGEGILPNVITAEGTIRRFSATYAQNGAVLAKLQNPPRQPLSFKLSYDQGVAQFLLDSVMTAYPVKSCTAFALQAPLDFSNFALQGTCAVRGHLDLPLPDNLLSNVTSLKPVDYEIDAQLSDSTVLIHGALHIPEPILYDQTMALKFNDAVNFDASALFSKSFENIATRFSLQTGALTLAQDSLFSYHMDTIHVAASSPDIMSDPIDLSLVMAKSKFELPDAAEAVVDSIQIAARTDLSGKLTGELALYVPFVHSHYGARLENLSLKLPFMWGADTLPDPGALHLEKILYEGQTVATADAVLQQRAEGIMVNAQLRTPYLPEAALDITVDAGAFTHAVLQTPFYAVRASAAIEKLTLDSLHLETISPMLEGYAMTGNASLHAHYNIGFSGDYPALEVNLENVNLAQDELKLNVSGLDAHVRVEQGLTGWRTPAGQTVHFDSFSLDNIHASNADMRWRMEENGEFCIDGLNVDWAGGTVRSLANKINPAGNEYDLTLHCNNLSLDEILRQICPEQVASMKGDVRVFGLLPMRLKGKQLFLGRGYLYTAPGTEGTIKIVTVADPEQDPAAGTVAASQLDLTREALSSFNYSWIKFSMGMRSDDEKAAGNAYKVSLNVFGEPAQPLPFKYDTQTGMFVRCAPEEIKTTTKLSQKMNVTLNIMVETKAVNALLKLSNVYEKLKKNFVSALTKPTREEK